MPPDNKKVKVVDASVLDQLNSDGNTKPVKQVDASILDQLNGVSQENDNVPRGTIEKTAENDGSSTENNSPDNYTIPKSLQPPTTGVKSEIAHDDLNTATHSITDFFFPKTPDAKQAPATLVSMEQAKQATANEITASKNYISTFYTENPELQNVLSVNGLGKGQGDIDPENGLNKIVNPDGDVDALSKFSGSALTLLADKKKQELAALNGLHPMVGGAVSATNEFAEPMHRKDEEGYQRSLQLVNERYNEKAVNLRNSIAGLAQIKVANQFIQDRGVSKNITPSDAQEIGFNYMEAVGDGETASKQRQLAAQNLLTPQEKVEAQRNGYKALQTKMMDAVANGQNAVSQHLANSVVNYPQKIRDANPEAVRENIIDALSNAVNESDKSNLFLLPVGRVGFSPSRETMLKAAKKVGIPESDLAGIEPSDLKNKRFGLAGEAASGLIGVSAAPIYEGLMRHVVAPLANKLSNDATGKDIVNEDALNKRFDANWYDHSDVAHYVGGQQLPSDELFQSGSKIETNKKSEGYLFPVGNPDVGKWNGDFTNVLGTIANGLGALSGFGSGIGAASDIASVAGYGKKAADFLGLASYMYLSGFDNNKKEATAALAGAPDSEGKVNWLANLYTAADILGMEIVKPTKQLANVFGKTIMSGSDLIDKLSKGGIDAISKKDIAQTFVKGLKESGVSFTEMTAGMDAITGGRNLADLMLAPDKFKNEDTGEKFLQGTVHAAIINAIPALVGGFNIARHEGPMIGSALYDVGSNPRPYLDAIDAKVTSGEMEPDKAASNKQVVNTLTNIVKNSTPDVSPVNQQPLTLEQKQQYAVNLFNESVLATKKKSLDDNVQIQHIDKYLKELQDNRKAILDNAGIPAPVAADTKESIDQAVTEKFNNTDAAQSPRKFIDKKLEDSQAVVEGINEELQKVNDLPGKEKALKVSQLNSELATAKGEMNIYKSFADRYSLLEGEKVTPDNSAPVIPAEPTQPTENATTLSADDNISINDVIGKPVVYKNKEGVLTQDGNTVIVKMNDSSPELELGSIDEIKDHSIKDYGLEQKTTATPDAKSVVNINDNGNVEVRGKEYVNNYSDPLMAISLDKQGNRSVTLETDKGEKRTFKGAVAEDIAYNLHMRELDKRQEQKALDEFINTDLHSKDDIESAIEAAPLEKAPDSNESAVIPDEIKANTDGTEITAGQPAAGPEPADNGGSKEVAPKGSANDIGALPETSKPERKKIAKKGPPIVAPDLFAPENVEKEAEVKKWMADHPEFDFENEPSSLKKKDEPGLFSEKNKTEVAGQNEAVKNTPASEKEIIPQAELANSFFGAEKSPDELAESAKVGSVIQDKFNKAEKVVGNRNVRIMADGSELPGRYVLLNADAVTPSHDPNNGFRSSEGFPMLETGRNPNDRNYLDKGTAGLVETRSNDFDGRAVQNIPTVDKNGVVIDGNDRSMAGKLAAKEKTDKNYIRVLKENAENFGFSIAQIEAMEKKGLHPRVVFVPDKILPYKTETFLRFNPKGGDGKVKSDVEDAITLGRTAPEELVHALGSLMTEFETTADFFRSSEAMRQVRSLLLRHGLMTNDGQNAFFKKGQMQMTDSGKRLIQNLMLGKLFGEEELHLLQESHADIRQKTVFAMSNIMAIESLGEKYSLKSSFDSALHLWDAVERYKDENNLKISMPDAYDLWISQAKLFEGEKVSPEALFLFNELAESKTSSIRNFTSDYLKSAKEFSRHGTDMFGNESKSKQQIILEYAELKKQLAAEHELARKADAKQPVGPAVGEGERAIPQGNSEQKPTGEETPSGNADQSGSDETTDRIADNYPTEEPPTPVVSEPMPEYGKEDKTPLPTPEEIKKTQVDYTDAIEALKKHTVNEGKVLAKIDGLENSVNDAKRNREFNTPEYAKMTDDLFKQKELLKHIRLKKKQAQLTIDNVDGKRLSDKIRALKGNIANDLIFSVPGIPPSAFKAMIDFVAGAVKIGENLHDAILNAVIKFKDNNPDLKFNEDELISKLQEHIGKIAPERDIHHIPVIESPKNKQAADAIIGKIKSDPQLKEKIMKDLMDHPKLNSSSKKAISDYVEYYTRHEDTITREPNNPHFLDQYKLTTADETKQFVSGGTIADIFGKVPEGNQDYVVMKQADMLADGERMIGLAREQFGSDVMQWGPRLLESIKEMKDGDTPKKAILLATMQGSLREEMLRNPIREGQIRKVLNATEEYWQSFIRKSALDLVAAKLLRMYRDKNLTDFYSDAIIIDKQRASRREFERQLKDANITDEVAKEGPLRDHSEAMQELQAENEKLKKELAEKPAGKKGSREKREEWGKKSELIMKDSELNATLEQIKEQIKKIKC